MKLNKIIECLEKWASPSLQEEYDNSGLIIGIKQNEIKGILVTLDCTEEIINEAIKKKCNLIISHHPLIFRPIKKITGSNHVEKSIIKAIQNSISIYSIHTNLDNILSGVNYKIADKIGLKNIKILDKKINVLSKIEFYIPKDYKENVLKNCKDDNEVRLCKIIEGGHFWPGQDRSVGFCNSNIQGKLNNEICENKNDKSNWGNDLIWSFLKKYKRI